MIGEARRFVVGAGLPGQLAAITLRDAGFEERLVLLGEEPATLGGLANRFGRQTLLMADNSAGAGVAHAPLTCFEQALTQFDRSLGSDTWHSDT